MKVILSHDVDHLFLYEHWTDSFIPGLCLRSIRAFLSGVPLKIVLKRFSLRQNRIEELVQFEKSQGASSSFFFGMQKGRNLSYNWKSSAAYIEILIKAGFEVGLHAQRAKTKSHYYTQMERMASLLPQDSIVGGRFHYLKVEDEGLNFLSEKGYQFDSSAYGGDIKKTGKVWNIPMSIMDAGSLSHIKNNLEEVKKTTLNLLESSEKKGNDFFVVNFHDIYYSEGYPWHKEWYHWLIVVLKERGLEFCSFKEAIELMEKRQIDG